MNTKPKPAQKGGFSSWIILALFVAMLSIYFIHWIYEKNRDEKTSLAILDFVSVSAERSRVVDKWWMTTDLPPTTETLYLLQQKKNHVLALLEANKDLLPETRVLVERFSDIKIGAFVNGKYDYLTINGVRQQPEGKAIGLCFVPEDASRRELVYSPMWKPESNLISLPAFDMPDDIFLAVVFHELGHALRHNRIDGGLGSDGVNQKRKDDLEEVRMHEFGASILDARSKRAYRTLVESVVNRTKSERRFDRLIESITFDEREALYKMFRCEDSVAPRAIVASNFVFTIGFRLSEVRGKGDEGKIAVYEWYTNGRRPWSF